ncbi:hypothetical protein QOZ80_7BG0585560 [Eleusine coracana subsp. coracana]|nr:hypothetical protein QOZ80_7BG0585560 [Eleusine coracana subsp. coracana]
MDVPSGEIDRISALPDKLLHVILGHLGSDFVGFVDWALAHRAADADMDSLKIEFTNKQQAPASPEKVSEWLRYAAQHVVHSVDIDIGYYYGHCSGRTEPTTDEQQAVVVEVPSHGKATSIFFVLPNHRFKLLPHDPAAAAAGARHEALTNLELFSLSFSSDGHELTDFVSSCCPRLRRLLVCGPKGLRRLTLRSDSLQDFSVSGATDLQTLDVATPNLRVFYMCLCFTYRKIYGNCDEYVDGTDDKLVRVVAPKLEEIVSMYNSRRMPADLDIHDLTTVRRLTDLYLDMHEKYHSSTDGVGFWLLENCPNVEHVDVRLGHMPRGSKLAGAAEEEELVDLTSEGKAPLGKVRSLVVRATGYLKHHFVASVSSLLVRCPQLTSLRVDIMQFCIKEATWGCFCEGVADKWDICGKVALESLEEMRMTGFGGTEEEMQLVRLLFDSSASSIKRMALVHASAANNKKAGVLPDVKDIDTIYHELMKIPCAHLGSWRLSKKTFTWTSDATS